EEDDQQPRQAGGRPPLPGDDERHQGEPDDPLRQEEGLGPRPGPLPHALPLLGPLPEKKRAAVMPPVSARRGPCIIYHYTGGAGAPRHAGTVKMRLLSYNIHKGIGGRDRKYRLGRIIAVVEEENPDLICLQEVDRHAPRSHYHDQPRLLADYFKAAGHLY